MCPRCGRRVQLVGPRVLAPHRIPLASLPTEGHYQRTLTGDSTIVLAWPRCWYGGIELDADPAPVRDR